MYASITPFAPVLVGSASGEFKNQPGGYAAAAKVWVSLIIPAREEIAEVAVFSSDSSSYINGRYVDAVDLPAGTPSGSVPPKGALPLL